MKFLAALLCVVASVGTIIHDDLESHPPGQYTFLPNVLDGHADIWGVQQHFTLVNIPNFGYQLSDQCFYIYSTDENSPDLAVDLDTDANTLAVHVVNPFLDSFFTFKFYRDGQEVQERTVFLPATESDTAWRRLIFRLCDNEFDYFTLTTDSMYDDPPVIYLLDSIILGLP